MALLNKGVKTHNLFPPKCEKKCLPGVANAKQRTPDRYITLLKKENKISTHEYMNIITAMQESKQDKDCPQIIEYDANNYVFVQISATYDLIK